MIQSSSASTVMVVSFVNSGLMNLYQAAGVIMGANIGTTVTSQLISLNLSALAPAIVMAGVVMVMFCNKTKIQRAGEVLLGFGILFMGLSGMSDSMSVLRESPQVVEIMSSLTSHFLAVMVGLVVTTVLQRLFCNSRYCPAAGTAGTSGYPHLLFYYFRMQHWFLCIRTACIN